MNRKLLIISRCHEPRGGADQIIADLCRELPAHGWDVTLGLTRGLRFDNPVRYAEFHGNLPMVQIDGRLGTRECRLRNLRKTLLKWTPDIVLSMRVFDVYEVVAEMKHASEAAPRLAIGLRGFEPAYFADLQMYQKFVDLCVTSGELVAKGCCELSGMNADRVVSIGGGVHAPVVATAARVPRQPLRLVYAGRLEQNQKRTLDLITLVSELKRRNVAFEIQIAGAGPEEATLKAAFSDELSNGTVRFLGWVDREELYRNVYPGSDVFIHFAAWEGVTIAPREAMAHGVVPVISQFTGLREERQFVDGVTALTFPVGNVSAAADCIERLLTEPGLITRLSAAAAKSQTGKYSFDGAISAWAESLSACIRTPAAVGEQIPRIRQHLAGRLSRLGIPDAVQTTVRRLLRSPVIHHSPGSEWPTSSGTLTAGEAKRIADFAAAREGRSSEVPAHE